MENEPDDHTADFAKLNAESPKDTQHVRAATESRWREMQMITLQVLQGLVEVAMMYRTETSVVMQRCATNNYEVRHAEEPRKEAV